MTKPVPVIAGRSPTDPLGIWKLLAPLPDPVGFAGMFAGSLNGKLVVGGGSQFPSKPLWLNGEKTFSDRIFTLADVGAAWRRHETRLPRPLAHFATAASDEAVYLAGGCDAAGVLGEVFEVRANGDDFEIKNLPSLPHPIAYGAAVIANGRLYVAGGQHTVGSKTATSEMWSLELGRNSATWSREPDLPGRGTFVGTMAAHAGAVYFVGGVGFDADGRSVQSRRIHRLERGAGEWEELPELPEPRVGAVSPCPVLGAGRIFVIGGYAAAFPGERREHPGFCRQTYFYDVARRSWSDGPLLPHMPPTNRDATGDAGPAPMVAAPGAIWREHVVVVSGEVRASARTPAVLALPLNSTSTHS